MEPRGVAWNRRGIRWPPNRPRRCAFWVAGSRLIRVRVKIMIARLQKRMRAPSRIGNDHRELSVLISRRPCSTSQSTSDSPPMKRSCVSAISLERTHADEHATGRTHAERPATFRRTCHPALQARA